MTKDERIAVIAHMAAVIFSQNASTLLETAKRMGEQNMGDLTSGDAAAMIARELFRITEHLENQS